MVTTRRRSEEQWISAIFRSINRTRWGKQIVEVGGGGYKRPFDPLTDGEVGGEAPRSALGGRSPGKALS